MPTMQEATNGNDMSGYSTLLAATMHLVAPSPSSPPPTSVQPVLNPMIRCPLSLTSTATPDALRQFYAGGMAPQVRFLSPQNGTAGGSSGGNASVTNTTVINGGGGGGLSTPSLSQAVTATVTSTLSPGGQYTGPLQVAKSFQLLSVATGTACRIQMYGTHSAQLFDNARGLDEPPAPGTTQNIVFDLALDTSPYQWTFQNRAGANGDTPQSKMMYLTVTNLSQSTQTISVTITYVALET